VLTDCISRETQPLILIQPKPLSVCPFRRSLQVIPVLPCPFGIVWSCPFVRRESDPDIRTDSVPVTVRLFFVLDLR
jgi:hypothetical protein